MHIYRNCIAEKRDVMPNLPFGAPINVFNPLLGALTTRLREIRTNTFVRSTETEFQNNNKSMPSNNFPSLNALNDHVSAGGFGLSVGAAQDVGVLLQAG